LKVFQNIYYFLYYKITTEKMPTYQEKKVLYKELCIKKDETAHEFHVRRWKMACKHGLYTQKIRDKMKSAIDKNERLEEEKIKKLKEIQETSPPLPDGWTITWNHSASRAVYYHPETKKVQWERPQIIAQPPTTIQVGTQKTTFTDEKLNCIKLRLVIEILKQKIEKEQQNYVEWCEKNPEHEYVRLVQYDRDKAEEMANHQNEIQRRINMMMGRRCPPPLVTKEHFLKIRKTKQLKEFAFRKRSRSDKVKKLQSELVSIKKQLECAENLSV